MSALNPSTTSSSTVFGAVNSGPIFGQPSTAGAPSGSVFGQTSNLFGAPPNVTIDVSRTTLNTSQPFSTGGNLFMQTARSGNANQSQTSNTFTLGQSFSVTDSASSFPVQSAPTASIFGSKPSSTSGNVFQQTGDSHMFGRKGNESTAINSASMFKSATTNVFGAVTATTSSSTPSLFGANSDLSTNVFTSKASDFAKQENLLFKHTPLNHPPTTSQAVVFAKPITTTQASYTTFGTAVTAIGSSSGGSGSSTLQSSPSRARLSSSASGLGITKPAVARNIFSSALQQAVKQNEPPKSEGVRNVFGGGQAVPLFQGSQPQSVFSTRTSESAGAPFASSQQAQSIFGAKTSESTSASHGSFKQQSIFGTKTSESSAVPSTDPHTGSVFDHTRISSTSATSVSTVLPSSTTSSVFGVTRTIRTDGSTKGGAADVSVFGASKSKDKEPVDQATSGTIESATSSKTERGRLSSRRRSSTASIGAPYDDVSMYTGLLCNNVPALANNQIALRKHFSKFGKVLRVFSNNNKGTASVKFADHASALNAKKNGRIVKSGLPAMTIFWNTRLVKSNISPSDADRERGTRSTDRERSAHASDREHRSRSIDHTRRDGRKSVSPTPDYNKDGSSTVSLQSLVGKVATTATQRREVLGARDKVLRVGMDDLKGSSLATSAALLGTCPDMCPERERYVREEQHRLSRYEMVMASDGTQDGYRVDHQRAVKEYSRSSADQEIPLPHELRPAPVLQMTMLYLLTHIADNGGEDRNWEEWYDFLWSRTRGIRKDITQQQLCDATSVHLLECCTRFHIFCAQRLCELDATEFDAKINTENLTKCLQTLKEMYNDLHQKGDVDACRNEAEFRSYTVLMNLNEGDTLREVQTLDAVILDSAPVRFAIEVYSALFANNYVRFFKLVQTRASFMQACILHRYFTQVRIAALNNICKSYSVSNRKSTYPLGTLVRLLCFEDISSASSFCVHHGLDTDDDQLVLAASGCVLPELPYPPCRSQRYIEVKRGAHSVGEALNNGPLSALELPSPVNSFDASGRFVVTDKQKAEIQLLQQKLKQQTSKATPEVTTSRATHPAQPQQPHQPQAKPFVWTNDGVKDVAKQLFHEVIAEHCLSISQTLVNAAQVYFGYANPAYAQIQDEVIAMEVRAIAQDVFSLEQKEQEARARALAAARRERVCVAVTDDVIAEVTNVQAAHVARQVYEDTVSEERQHLAQSCAPDVSNTIMMSVLADMATSVCCDVYQTDVVERQAQLNDTHNTVQLLVKGRWFKAWYQEFRRRQRIRNSMLEFPAAPPTALDSVGTLQALLPNVDASHRRVHVHNTSGDVSVGLGEHARLTVNSPWSIDTRSTYWTLRVAASRMMKGLMMERAWQPLDLATLVWDGWKDKWTAAATSITSKLGDESSNCFWKLVLILPDSAQDMSLLSSNRDGGGRDDGIQEDIHYVYQWAKAKLRKGTTQQTTGTLANKSELLSLYTVSRSTATQPYTHSNAHSHGSVSLCVRTHEGRWSDTNIQRAQTKRLYQGTKALTIIVYLSCDPSVRQTLLLQYKKSLQHCLSCLPPKCHIPLIVVVYREQLHGSTSVPTAYTNDSIVTQQVIHALDLEHYCNQGSAASDSQYTARTSSARVPISTVTVHVLPYGYTVDHTKCSTQYESSLRSAITRSPSTPELISQCIWSYADEGLCTNIFPLVYQNLAYRRRKGLLDQSPLTLVDLYNTYIRHLAEVVSEPVLQEMSWPITEFADTFTHLPAYDWNSTSSLANVRQALLDLSLPDLDTVLDDLDSWSAAVREVWVYIEAVIENCNTACAVDLVTKIQCILRKYERHYHRALSRCWLTHNTDTVTSCLQPTHDMSSMTYTLTSAAMPWTDIIRSCIDFKLQLLRENTDHVEQKHVLMVYYRAESLHQWVVPQFWLDITKPMDQTNLSVSICAQPPITPVATNVTKRAATKRKHTDTSTASDSDSPAVADAVASYLLADKHHAIHTTSTPIPLAAAAMQQQTPARKRLLSFNLDANDSTAVQDEMEKSVVMFDEAVSVERKRAREYELFLQQTLNEGMQLTGDSNINVMQCEATDSVVSRKRLGLDESVVQLNKSIESNKNADSIYEMKLQSYLGYK